MADLIDRDELIKYVRSLSTSPLNGWETLGVLSAIERQKTVDAVPVVHGRWIGKPIAGYATVKCSVCGGTLSQNSGKYLFCPNCGAKMDAEGETI